MEQLGITRMNDMSVCVLKILPHDIGFSFIELQITLGVRSIHTRYFLIIKMSSNFNLFDKGKLLNI